jgi:hypothetical protein
MTTHTAKTPALKTPAVRNVHHKDASENRVTFTVSLSAPNALWDRRVIALTQIGTTATYQLTEERHQRSASFQSIQTMLALPKQITGKNAAWAAYKARRTLALSEPHAYVLGEVIETRPTGITDPKDRRYVACNFRTIQSKGGQAGNCYYVYTDVVVRCDDAPLTADDIAALKAYPRGQVHVVTGNPGDLTATVHSEVDSSD